MRKKQREKSDLKAVVTYGLGATLNAGDFESVKVNFSLSYECPIDEVQKTIKKIKEEVKKQMKAEVAELKEIIKR